MINYMKYGSTPYRMVLVHGGPGAAGEMAPVAKVLADKAGILEPLQTRYSIHEQIAELKKVIENHAKIPVILIGFSWGAWLSILFASKHPGLVNKLILIGCPPFESKYANQIYDTRLSRLNDKEKSEFISTLSLLHKDSDTYSKACFYTLVNLVDKADAFDPLPDNRKEVIINSEIFQKVWKEAEEFRKSGKLINALKSLNIPITCIHGEYDPHPAKGVSSALSKHGKTYNFVLLNNCGHKPWIERQACQNFYDSLIGNLKL